MGGFVTDIVTVLILILIIVAVVSVAFDISGATGRLSLHLTSRSPLLIVIRHQIRAFVLYPSSFEPTILKSFNV